MEFNHVYGIHAVEKLLSIRPETLHKIFILDGEKNNRIKKLIQLAHAANVSVQTTHKKNLDQLAQGERHQGIVAHISSSFVGNENHLMDHMETLSKGYYVALDAVEDPRNVGAVIRSAEALGASGIILPKDKSASITATVRKVACGAAEILPIFQVTNLVRELKALQMAGFWAYASLLNEKSQSLFETKFAPKSILVLGSESNGLRQLTQKTCDEFLAIPMTGITESLNVSVAAGIMCSEIMRQTQSSTL